MIWIKTIRKVEERLEYLSSDKKTIALYKVREKEKMKIAKSLLDILDIETIALKIGLTIEKVRKLKS